MTTEAAGSGTGSEDGRSWFGLGGGRDRRGQPPGRCRPRSTSITGAATSVWQVGALRAGAWAARGLRVPARNALLADIVDPAVYGRAYGFERAMDNLGAIGGPLLAIGLVALVGTRGAIGLSVIPGLLATAAILYAIRHTQAPKARERTRIRFQVRPVLHGRLKSLFAGISAFEFGNCAATLLILRATELLEPRRSHTAAATTALWLYVSYNGAGTVASIPAGRHADRTTPRRTLAIGVIAFGLAYGGLTRDVHGWLALTPWFILAGIGIGCVETAEHAAVAAYAPAEIRGSAFGLLAAVQSFGNFAASGIAGLLWTTAGPVLGLRLPHRLDDPRRHPPHPHAPRPAPAAVQSDGQAAA
jgi:MFS family permease